MNSSMLDAWQAATERFCSEYRHLPAPQLRARAQELLHGITQLLDQRLTSTQRREVLALAGRGAPRGLRRIRRCPARMPDRRQAEIALDRATDAAGVAAARTEPGQSLRGRPAKFDFYAMDCYRVLGEDVLAELHARRVIDRGTGRHGLPRSPMRTAEALVTLGVVAARAGDVETAVRHGRRALDAARTSQPSLMMCSRELVETLVGRDRTNADVAAYRDLVRTIRVGAPAPR